MNRSKQTIVESKWLTCENALNFRSSVGTAFSFLLPDLLLWAFRWLSKFLNFWFLTIIISFTMVDRFHNLWDDKNKNHLNKTRWWRDCHLELPRWNMMNSSQWTSHFVQVSINDLSSFQLFRWCLFTQLKIQKPWLDGDPLEWASFASDLNFILLWDPRTTMGQSWE